MTVRKQCERLYKEAFGESEKFDTMLFDLFFDKAEILEKDGAVAAMYFKMPCVLNLGGVKIKSYYIYAVTTRNDLRHHGLMSQLFEKTQTESDAVYFLKPSSEGVIQFYKQAGFRQIVGTSEPCNAVIEVNADFKSLSKLCEKPVGDYPVMIKCNTDIKRLTFQYTLE